MRTSLLFLLCLPVITSSFCHAAGIQIGRTRIIYDAAKKEVALPLTNSEKELPWLIQTWTDTGDGKTRGPFIVTPPLFRLDPQKEQSLRITWNGSPLPKDKESLFYLNVRTVPATAAEDATTHLQNTTEAVLASRGAQRDARRVLQESALRSPGSAADGDKRQCVLHRF